MKVIHAKQSIKRTYSMFLRSYFGFMVQRKHAPKTSDTVKNHWFDQCYNNCLVTFDKLLLLNLIKQYNSVIVDK